MIPNDENPIAHPERGPGLGSQAAWRQVAAAARQEITCEKIHLLLDYWQSMGSDAHPPGRRDLNPARMAPVLSHVWLMDYEAETRRLGYRLVGDEVRSRYDTPLVGRYLDEIVEPDAYPTATRYFLDCPGLPAIAVLTGRLYSQPLKPGYGERLLLPLVSSGGAPEGLIGITICDQTIDSQTEATLGVGRRISIFPLDGSDPITQEA